MNFPNGLEIDLNNQLVDLGLLWYECGLSKDRNYYQYIKYLGEFLLGHFQDGIDENGFSGLKEHCERLFRTFNLDNISYISVGEIDQVFFPSSIELFFRTGSDRILPYILSRFHDTII